VSSCETVIGVNNNGAIPSRISVHIETIVKVKFTNLFNSHLFLFSLSLSLSLSLWFSIKILSHTYQFQNIIASSAVIDDVAYYAGRRIFNTNL